MKTRRRFRRLVPLWLVPLAGLAMASSGGDDRSSRAPDWTVRRRLMLEAVHRDAERNRDLLGGHGLSQAVARALAAVPRHEFVPPEFRDQAYANHPLPIGHEQTISQPSIVAIMTELMALAPGDTVLEVGTGSGYQAAVLAEVLSGGLVHTIEIVPELAAAARERLARLGYHNVAVHTGDGYLGLPDRAPFAAIMITAAAPEIPPPLLAQLRPGGRLVTPVGPPGETQWLTLVVKDPEGGLAQRALLPVRFVPLIRR